MIHIITVVLLFLFLWWCASEESISSTWPIWNPNSQYSTQYHPEAEVSKPEPITNYQYSTPFEGSSQEDDEDSSEKIEQLDDLKSKSDDLDYEIRKLRNNSDEYDAEEYSNKLRKLKNEADDLSSEADDLWADDASSSFDDTSNRLRNLRNDIDDDHSYFYKEKDDEIYSGLKKSQNDIDSASSSLEDLSTNLE